MPTHAARCEALRRCETRRKIKALNGGEGGDGTRGALSQCLLDQPKHLVDKIRTFRSPIWPFGREISGAGESRRI